MPLLHDHSLCGCRHAHHLSGFATKQAPKHYPPDLSIEPVHMKIDLHVDVDKHSASGEVVHTLNINSKDARTLKLHAVDLDIFEVFDANRDIKTTWRYDGKVLEITWPEGSLEQGDEHKLHIQYAVDHPDSGLFFSTPDTAYPDRDRWACTDHETERARHWLPCVDLPQVRCKLDFHLRADKTFTILANGKLMSEEEHEDGETKTAHWKLDWPCPSYITCFALGEFQSFEDQPYKDIPVAYFAAKHHSAKNLERSFGRTNDMLEFITKKLDTPFPYPKYYQFALPGIGGAMENISLVSWDDVFVLDETLAQEWTWLVDQVNIHEMAHSYFGDALVCRDFAHAWLKESWATYMESCWLEHRYGQDELLYDVYRNMHSYFVEADSSYKRPIVTNIYDTSWHMYDRHLYPGGGARLHMLRRQLGDDAFWQGVRSYVQENMGKNVETHDFRRALEKSSGKSLVQWFEQWIYSAGYPHLEVKYSWNESTKEASFTITQKQADASVEGDPQRPDVDPVFVMDLEFGWRIKGKLHTSSIKLTQRVHQHTIKMDEKPDMVLVDPDNKLVKKLDFDPGQDLLFTQLTDGPDVVARIHAAKTLLASNKPKEISKVLAQYKQEAFWGVKQQILQGLAKCTAQQALDALVEIAAEETDGLLLETLVQSLGAFNDEVVTGTLLGMLERGIPYRAQMAAFIALGAQRESAPLELLTQKATTPTFGFFPQTGAAKGLANTRKPEAMDTLIDVARRKSNAQHHRVRASAMRAIGTLANYVSDTTREYTIDFLLSSLRDKDQEVATAAAYALISAHATQARQPILMYAKRLAHQDRVDLEHALEGLAPATKHAKIADLESQLETVKKAQRKLLERLEKVESK